MSISTSKIDRAWSKIGMEITEGRDRWAYFVHDGKKVTSTRRSHGRGKLSGNHEHFIRQQMKLNEAQFADLIACPLDRAGYVEILKEKKLIKVPKSDDPA